MMVSTFTVSLKCLKGFGHYETFFCPLLAVGVVAKKLKKIC